MKSKKLKPLVKKVVKHYRYFCDACTKIAFWATEPKANLRKDCQHCGRNFKTKEKNYILDTKK